MAMIVNGQQIDDSTIAEEIEMMKFHQSSGCGCGCDDGCGEEECGDGCGDDCGCSEGDGCGCGDGCGSDPTNETEMRRAAESRLVIRTLLEQEAKSMVPAPSEKEIQAMIMDAVAQAGSEAAFFQAAGVSSLKDPTLCRMVDNSLRVTRMMEAVTAKVAPPTLETAKKHYREFAADFEDETGKKLAFEDVSEQLMAELYDEAKNAAIEAFVEGLLKKAKIQQV